MLENMEYGDKEFASGIIWLSPGKHKGEGNIEPADGDKEENYDEDFTDDDPFVKEIIETGQKLY